MNKLETPTMEGEIQQEETGTPPKTNLEPKIKTDTKLNLSKVKGKSIKIIKGTRLITVFILFFVFILISVGLIVYSSKKVASLDIQPDIVITTPKPQNVIKDPQLKEIEDKLDDYDKKVDQLGNNLDNYQPPQIDLNINF